jgi:hypothetical protein
VITASQNFLFVDGFTVARIRLENEIVIPGKTLHHPPKLHGPEMILRTPVRLTREVLLRVHFVYENVTLMPSHAGGLDEN